ncbi:spore germination protein [Bacillus sp. ISL-47]|uniref:spore germination protein n=1 Tax=Bacillus sp. ISL-47 TaxID=2819130 RepID=UPI001BE6EDD4|nr:spore germination protein [Bacillus sp. ISL-47]MBT2686749.1 spore germination protein [Bacillus sp. ISL-47]MBT2706903.1 spore germination protein [Pseudomonas sp. ISL-84]
MRKVQTQKADQLKEWFKDSADVVIKEKNYPESKMTHSLVFLYCPNLADIKYMNEVIFPTIKKVMEENGQLNINDLLNLLEVNQLEEQDHNKTEIEQKLFSGDLLIFNNETNEIFFLSVSNFPKRSPEESNIETSIRGPRDGLVENISDNMALIRQRLKTSSLKSIEYSVGEVSRTKMILLYLDDKINSTVLEEAKKRLDAIKIDIVASTVEIEELLYDKTFSLFPLMDNSGRPDFAVYSLTQGKFVILVDGNPNCLVGPITFNHLLYSPEDLHDSFFYISIIRILRLMAFFTTIFLPGFYISLIAFQLDQIPYPLIATIAVSRIGLPLSAAVETFIMLVLFELFKEAGVRLPKAVGQTVAVLGGLFIGDAAIRAGLTSPSCLVIIAITVISGYTLVNQNISGNIVILRYFVLIISSIFGLYGFFISLFLILTWVVSLESFGQPYISYLIKPNLADRIKCSIRQPFQLVTRKNRANKLFGNDSQKE